MSLADWFHIERCLDESAIKERPYAPSIGVTREIEKIDVGGTFKKPEFSWLARGFEQELGVIDRGVSIRRAAYDQNWTADLSDMVDRFQIVGRDAQARFQLKKQQRCAQPPEHS